MNKHEYVKITPVPHTKKLYKLTEELILEFDNVTVTLPIGFQADGATLPRFIWSLIGLHPLSTTIVTGAFIHDATYTPLSVGEKRSNELMNAICKDHGMGPVRRMIIKHGVSLLAKPWFYALGRNSVWRLNRLKRKDPNEYERRKQLIQSFITYK